MIKRRFIDKRYNTIVFRHDLQDSCERIDVLKYKYSNYDAIIFSDYCKGFLTEQDISYICQQASDTCIKFIDTKKKISDFIQYCDFLKINSKESKENIHDLDRLRDLCQIIITNGEHGATYINSLTQTIYPTQKIDIRDVCGAGDTFLSALVVKYLQTKNIGESILYANVCSSKVVSKFGICTP